MANETDRERNRGRNWRGPTHGGRRDEDYDDDRQGLGYGRRRYGESAATHDYPQERRGDDWQRRHDEPPPYRSREGGYYRDQASPGAAYRGPESGDSGGRNRSMFGEDRAQYGQAYGGRYADVQGGQSGYGQSEEWYGGQQPYAGHQRHGARTGSYQSEYGTSGSGQGPYRDSAYGQNQRPGQAGMSESERYGQAGMGYGHSGYSDYGQHGRAGEIDDPDYLEWRRNQLNRFDDDYRSYRTERQKKFSDEFDEYRKNRPASSTSTSDSSGKSSSNYGSKSTTETRET